MPNQTRSIDDVRREVVGKRQTYSLALDRDAAVDVESRTAELAFASDQPVEHYFGLLRLSMREGHVRTGRLKRSAPLLMDHDTRDHVGTIESYAFGSDGIARAKVRFSRSTRGQEVFQDVIDGIRSLVSVGFLLYDLELESDKDGEMPVYRSNDWEPYEISLVSVPADISVGVGRDLDQSQVSDARTTRANSTNGEINMNEPIVTPEPPVVEPPVVTRSAVADATQNSREIIAFADVFGHGDLARKMLAASSAVTLDDVRAAIREANAAPAAPALPVLDPQTAAERSGAPVAFARTLPRHGKVKAFQGEGKEERAYRFGKWLLGRVFYDADSPPCVAARQYCDTHGLTRAMSEGVNESGGYTVLPEFSNDIIDLREMYGKARQLAKVIPMASDTLIIPRSASGLTPYFVAEAGSITASDKGWDQVQLVAKKLAVLARYSTEVSEDSIINFADDIANEIAYAFANKEDECFFNGDGGSTYGGITGVRQRLLDTYTTTGGVGLKLGTGNAYSELTLTDFEGTVGNLPEFADTEAAVWVVHRSFYWNVMVKVMLASGGVTAAEIEDARKQRYMGYRVVFSQVMPKTEANGQVCALLGDFSKAAFLGSRRDTTIATSEHSRFANDQIEIRGTERFDINVHSVGDATNPGPVVGLITANS